MAAGTYRDQLIQRMSDSSGGGQRGFGGGLTPIVPGLTPQMARGAPPAPGLGLGGYQSPQQPMGGYQPGPAFGVIGNPNGAPSPGLGTGAPSPVMYEDYSSGYPGRFNDPLIALLQALLSSRHPNGM